MATYIRLDNTHPTDSTRAVGLAPVHAAQLSATLPQQTPTADGMPALDAALDPRYKAGGDTTWERPGQ